MATSGRSRRSPLARLVRIVLLALLVAFAIGFTIGSLIRRELERPIRYYGMAPAAPPRGHPAHLLDPSPHPPLHPPLHPLLEPSPGATTCG